jgi:hypothetical protein
MMPDRTDVVRHIVDSAAVSCSITLIYASIEIFVLQMSSSVSVRARLLIAVLIFLGLGSAFSRLRDLSLRRSGVQASTSEPLKLVHDVMFTMATNAVATPIVYGFAGATAYQTFVGTLVTLGVSTLTGPINGLMIDRFRSWAGLPNSGRFAIETSGTRSIIFVAVAVVTVLLLVTSIYTATK